MWNGAGGDGWCTSNANSQGPEFRPHVVAAVLPTISPLLLLPIVPALRYLDDVMDPVFFVESPFAYDGMFPQRVCRWQRGESSCRRTPS